MQRPASNSTHSTPQTHEIKKLLESIIDPESGINIVDMGLIYDIVLTASSIDIKMTMTSAACPVSDLIVEDIEKCLQDQHASQFKINVEVTFNPPWDPSMMSESARERFGW